MVSDRPFRIQTLNHIAVAGLERFPRDRFEVASELAHPDAIMLRPSVVAVLDGVKGEVIVVSPAWVGSGLSARAAYAQAAERVMDAVRDLERPVPSAGARGILRPAPAATATAPTPGRPAEQRVARCCRQRRGVARTAV